MTVAQLPGGEASGLPSAHHTDNTRLEAFSDAMFGFAATLLVVSLDAPSTYESLVQSLYGFLPFAMSFSALAVIWSIHREFYRRFPVGDRQTVILNTILMFLVLFFVYPLKFLTRMIAILLLQGHYGGEAVHIEGSQIGGMFMIYGAGWFGVFAAFALMYRHAATLAQTLDFGPDDVRVARDKAGHHLVTALVGVVSFALAFSQLGLRFGVPGFAYALLGPALSVYSDWRRKRAIVAARA